MATAKDPTAVKPLDERDLARLQELLDKVPAPLEPLDDMSLDGYLCGVLLQPQPVPEVSWMKHVIDVDGRPAPARFAVEPLHALVRRRHAELARAIAQREWFDPWVYELEEDASPSETVMPWVAGFATAMELFPRALAADAKALIEPLALLYRHLDPDDLEDADDLLAEIDTLEPPAELAEAVEDLVRGVLLIADITRPQAVPQPRAPAAARSTASRKRPRGA
jgi:uncharacterized protein